MMQYYGYSQGIMGGGYFSPFCFLTWFVWTGVGVLLIVWLWQQISKK